MAANLPYLSTPGSIKSALERIRHAATPPRVTGDFVETILQIKGGAGRSIPPFLKRIGFAASDASPTDLYREFRNPSSAARAMATAIKHGYQDLAQSNEYFYRLGDKELLALIVQVTGVETDSRAAALTLATMKHLKSFADFDAQEEPKDLADRTTPIDESVIAGVSLPSQPKQSSVGGVGLNLSYTINLNLPATADQAVFNAIFRSLRDHLLASNG
ncbi:DUF5343 domain-containing protein [Duganella sp. S19_KUP01_CR8]|uniref:DUF5343 domain-containing protein n=1 Tax=Duganella sp. S19_KUP01_CR8 TaxID=3025502 RepID=UPI002FCD82DB